MFESGNLRSGFKAGMDLFLRELHPINLLKGQAHVPQFSYGINQILNLHRILVTKVIKLSGILN